MQLQNLFHVYSKLNHLLLANGLFDNRTEAMLSLIAPRIKPNLKSCCSSMDSFFAQFRKEDYEQIIALLDSLTRNELVELVYYIINRAGNNRMTAHEKITDSLSNLVISLLNIDGGDIICDLGCGEGKFLLNAVQEAKSKNINLKSLYGIEINNRQAKIADLALACVTDTPTHIDSSNIITSKMSPIYTKAYSFVPFGGVFTEPEVYKSKMFKCDMNPRHDIGWIFVDKLLSSMFEYNSRAIAIVPVGMLFRTTDDKYRHTLIESGYLEGIIELPLNSLEGIGVKPALLIFSGKNKSTKILNASEMFTKIKGQNCVEVSVQHIIDCYNSTEIKSISKEELLKLNNISPSSISDKSTLQDKLKGKESFLLKDVAEVFTGSQYTIRNFEDKITDENTGYKILTSSDIKDGIVNWDELPNIIGDKKLDKFALRKGDLVMTSKSSKFKTAVVENELDSNVIVTGGMIIIRPIYEKIRPMFLKIYFDSEIGKLAVNNIQKGVYIRVINSRELQFVPVPNISLEKQDMMSKKYQSQLGTLAAYKQEIERLQNKLDNFFVDETEE